MKYCKEVPKTNFKANEISSLKSNQINQWKVLVFLVKCTSIERFRTSLLNALLYRFLKLIIGNISFYYFTIIFYA